MENVLAEWGWILGVILFGLQEAIAASKLKSNSVIQLVINILDFLVSPKKIDKE